jgi:two-component system chemotaxis sensor kinase CheA
MDEMLIEFLAESAEQIETASAQIVAFERNPEDAALISSIFRLVHTIKGTCGFLGLERLQRLTHHAESLIGCLREGSKATPEVVSAILSAVDQVKVLLTDLEEAGHEPDGDDSVLIALLERHVVACQGGEVAEGGEDTDAHEDLVSLEPEEPASAEAPETTAASPTPELEPVTEPEAAAEPEIVAKPHSQESLDALVASLRRAKLDVRQQQAAVNAAVKGPAPAEPQAPAESQEPAAKHAEASAVKAPPASEPQAAATKPAEASDDSRRGKGADTIRINLNTLERIMNLVSELVLTRNQLIE